MLSHTELKRGVVIIVDGQPYEVLDAMPQRYAQRKLMIQTKLKNLISGNFLERTVHQGESFEEAEIDRLEVKFLYKSKGKFFFCEKDNPAKRFDLGQEQMGKSAEFLKPDQIVEGMVFNEKITNILLPIKVQLKVAEAPPGVKGDRAQGGMKAVVLESGATINVPLFIEEGDIVEVNTDSGEYSKRVE